MNTRPSEAGGSHLSTGRASSRMQADIGEACSSMAVSALTTPSSNGSQPMIPTFGLLLRLPDQVLGAAEADLEPHLARSGEANSAVGVWLGRQAQARIERQTRGRSSRSSCSWRALSLRPRLRPNERSSRMMRISSRSSLIGHSAQHRLARKRERPR